MKAKQKQETVKSTVELSTYSPLWGICEDELQVLIAHYEGQIGMYGPSVLIDRRAVKRDAAGFYSQIPDADWLKLRNGLLMQTLKKLYALRDGARPVQSREVVYAYS